MDQETADVLVLGAGVAGLAAASVLSQAGLRVIVIEARERIGGRVFTQHVPGFPLPIELGAEFIHGRPHESFALVEQAGLLVYEIAGERWLSHNRQLQPASAQRDRSGQIFADMLSAEAAPDRSFQSFLDRYQRDPAWRDAAALAASYVEGFDAADISKVSVQALVLEQRASAASDGDRAFRIASGYDRLVAALAATADAARVTFQLGRIAQRVSWQRGQVAIETAAADGAVGRFTARQALITLPLGVLQAPAGARGAVDFQPPLAEHAAAAQQLAMGQVFKMTVRFRERLWAHERLPLTDPAMDPQQLSFLYARSATLPTWWTAYPAIVPQLTAWAAGPSAAALLDLPEPQQVERVTQALAQALDLPHSRVAGALIGTHTHNWHTDPFARGAYSYVMVGGMDAVRALAAPVAGTLFFAGEATNSDGHTGTVHGAIATGQRAAREILVAAAQPAS